jgi:imidazolonepropionase-like amidohydrolase
VEGGRIAQVQAGGGGTVPAGCRTIDGTGRLLAPGLIDPLTGLGLVEVMQEQAANDLGPKGEAAKEWTHAGLKAADSFNPASQLLPVARLGGVTTAVSVPDGGIVPGQSAFVTTDGGIRRTALALHIKLGLHGREAIKSTRSDVLARVRELLFDARAYAQRKADYEGNRMRKLAASRLDLEELQPFVTGALPVVVHADRVSDLRAALALARDFKLRLVIAGGAEAWQVAQELAQANVPVILRPVANLPETFDSLGSRLDGAVTLVAAGVKVLISTINEPHMVRTLNQEAGNAVAWGMPYADAVRAVTSNVADAFGLEGGRITQGAPADLVLWNGDPLEVSSRPLGMWIGGKQAHLVSRQQALFEKYKRLPEK